MLGKPIGHTPKKHGPKETHTLDKLTRKFTAFDTFEQFVTAEYQPTICFAKGNSFERNILCNYWDRAQSRTDSFSGKTGRSYKVHRCCLPKQRQQKQ